MHKFSHNDKQYVLGDFKREIADKFTNWAVSVLPSPLAVLKDIKDLPPDVQKMVVTEATRIATGRRHFFDTDINSLLGTDEGERKLTHLLLLQNHPDIKEDEAHEAVNGLVEQVGKDGFKEILKQCQDLPPVSKEDAEREVLKKKG